MYVIMAAVSASALVSCSGSPGPTPAASGGGTRTAAGGVASTITVDAPPNASSAAAAYGASSGTFEQAGIKVALHTHQGAQSTIVGLMSGAYPVVWATVPDILAAQAKGLPISIVALGDQGAPGQIRVLSRSDSGITKPADLVGKRVAIPSPTSSCALAIPNLLKAVGVDAKKVQFVTVPQVDHESTLQNKVTDAVCTPEPFQSEIKLHLKTNVVLDVFTGGNKDMLIGAYVATNAYVQKNPEAVTAFRDGLTAANQKADADQSVVRALIPKYSGVTDELAKSITLPTYIPNVTDTAALQSLADLMVDNGLLTAKIDAGKSFAAPAPSGS
ncbi:ABC transporter substrate-binding protein [Streptomyces sp. RLB1-33]|nr:ABC transporter substrate-binding protein [Streptomyces sp. RLB1-33]QIY76440.1 ABC transporter substrate-binding protein [Streptomyces sp. RLB1-33]